MKGKKMEGRKERGEGRKGEGKEKKTKPVYIDCANIFVPQTKKLVAS